MSYGNPVLRRKDVYSPSEAATVCGVAPRTLAKWMDAGRLQGYTIPGSQHRRIPHDRLLAFLKSYSLPVPSWMTAEPRVLLVSSDPCVSASLTGSVDVAPNLFAAGLAIAGSTQPMAVVLDLDLGRGACLDAAGTLRRRSEAICLVALVPEDVHPEHWPEVGALFDVVLQKPVDPAVLLRAVS